MLKTNSVIIPILLIVFSCTLFAQDKPQWEYNPNYQLQTDLYKIYKTKQADVVMLGNSLTAGADWNELLGRPSVVNRGIPSDIIAGFLNRMKYVYDLEPKVVFILGGLNDIYSWIPVESVYQDYIRIVEGLKLRGITPVIQSTLYAGTKWPNANERNPHVTKLNTLLQQYAEKNNIEFIDLNKYLSRDETLIGRYTYDGVHLNAQGFRVWSREVDRVLTQMGM